MDNKGISLIFVVFLVGALLFAGITFYHVLYSTNASLYSEKNRVSSFYLAEAGVEQGKANAKHNPNWYTDIKSTGDLTDWLANKALGIKTTVDKDRSYKTVKVMGGAEIYGIGYCGDAVSIIKSSSGTWEEL